jgi:hypothetical protein
MYDHQISIVDLNSKSKLAYSNIDFKNKFMNSTQSYNYKLKGVNTTKNDGRNVLDMDIHKSRSQT